MLVQFSVVFCVVFSLGYVSCKKLPSTIPQCSRSDPEALNKCVRDRIEQLRPRLKDGIPELYIPSVNPLKVSEATLGNGQRFNASFKDIEIYHMDEFLLEDLNIDLVKHSLEVSATFPKLRVKSVFEVSGTILILKLNGKGPADGNFTNVHAILKAEGDHYMKNGKEHISLGRNTLKLNLGKPVLHFDNVLGDDKELNEQTNKVLNDNIEAILVELEPVVNKVIIQVMSDIINRVFEKYSLEELFLD